MVWRNPRPVTALGIAALRKNGWLVRKSEMELKENTPPVSETPNMLSRMRSTPPPSFKECFTLVKEKSSYAWIEVQWKLNLEGDPSPPENWVRPGTETPAAFSPGIVPNDGSDE